MGWDFQVGASKWDVINDIKKIGLMDHEVNGDEMWTLIRHPNGAPEIVLFLLGKQKIDGIMSWGYKDMLEAMGPYYYKCPLRFLEVAPVQNEAWRIQVKNYWQDKEEQRR